MRVTPTPPLSPAGRSFPGGRFLSRLSTAFFLLLLALPAWPSSLAQAYESATVAEVVDGDTIRVRTGGVIATVRMIGIDTPERGHPGRPREFLADEAADALSAMCIGKTVRLERDLEDTDKYGRLLRYVHSGDGGLLFNREMVRIGMARVYRRFPFSRLADFEAAEDLAKTEGTGLWRNGGLDELRWVRLQKQEPVTVWPLGGGEYGVVHDGMGKAGIAPGALQAEVANISRLRTERSDAEFGREARKAGYAPDPIPAATRAPADRQAPSDGVVTWEGAHEQIGREITVEGTVVRARRSRKTVFLNFHPNWKRYLTVVLFTGRIKGLPASPESYYLEKKIRVRGTVGLYKDRPEIVVKNADEIRVVP